MMQYINTGSWIFGRIILLCSFKAQITNAAQQLKTTRKKGFPTSTKHAFGSTISSTSFTQLSRTPQDLFTKRSSEDKFEMTDFSSNSTVGLKGTKRLTILMEETIMSASLSGPLSKSTKNLMGHTVTPFRTTAELNVRQTLKGFTTTGLPNLRNARTNTLPTPSARSLELSSGQNIIRLTSNLHLSTVNNRGLNQLSASFSTSIAEGM